MFCFAMKMERAMSRTSLQAHPEKTLRQRGYREVNRNHSVHCGVCPAVFNPLRSIEIVGVFDSVSPAGKSLETEDRLRGIE